MTSFYVAGGPTTANLGLASACGSLGYEAAVVAPREVGRRVAAGGTVLGRLDVLPSLDGIERGLGELRAVADRGARVLNGPDTLLAAHDKLATAIRLGQASVPHPRTSHFGSPGSSSGIELPAVLKPRFGSWGRDVVLCTTRSQLRTALRRLARRRWFKRQGVLVQEFIPPVGYDLRVLVAGGRVVGAVKRLAAYGEWRTNVALGAVRVPVDPTPQAALLALEAAAAANGDFVGVDLLPLTDGGYVVLELNGAVEFNGEYMLNGTNIFEAVVTALLPRPAQPAVAGNGAGAYSPGSMRFGAPKPARTSGTATAPPSSW
ncbi:MAG TPA: RimK family alpha-L-glutamate ligase [Gaiellaceae bacterium]|nr:RimK family alpha-L-glutamate ligase [Gaiellaceae bacterium]